MTAAMYTPSGRAVATTSASIRTICNQPIAVMEIDPSAEGLPQRQSFSGWRSA
jgi:hypothetical protein